VVLPQKKILRAAAASLQLAILRYRYMLQQSVNFQPQHYDVFKCASYFPCHPIVLTSVVDPELLPDP
jgi:hypothetical protein